MTHDNNRHGSDVLDLATEAIRSAPIDENRLRAALVATQGRIVEAQREAEADTAPLPSRLRRWRTLMQTRRIRWFAAAAAVLLAVGVTGLLTRSGSVAFADVLRTIQNARTVTYTMTVETLTPSGEPVPPPFTVNVTIAEPNRLRMEFVPGEGMPPRTVHIWNLGSGRHLTLNPANKTAMLLEAPVSSLAAAGLPLNVEFDAWVTLRGIRDLSAQAAEPLGRKVLDGREATGFRVNAGPVGAPIDVWADARTGQPLCVEHTSTGPARAAGVSFRYSGSAKLPPETTLDAARLGKPGETVIIRGGGPTLPDVPAEPVDPERSVTRRQVISNIVFDQPLEETVFSQEVPEGYKLTELQPTVISTMVSGPQTNEQQVTDALRRLAERAGNVFPPGDADGPQFGGLSRRLTQAEIEEQTKQALQAFACVRAFILNQKARYVGAGVAVGDAEKPVLVWETSGGGYRAIFGDLSARDLTPDKYNQVPK